MHTTIKATVALAAAIVAAQASAEITFYQREGFAGRAFTTYETIVNLDRYGLNDKASSVVVQGQRYEVCEHERFHGRCVVLRPGSYASLGDMGLNNQVSSVRPIPWNVQIDPHRFAPEPRVAVRDTERWRRRDGERLFEVAVVDVRAVMGPPEQRCWVERERVVSEQPNVGGAVVGALIGGVIGHQIGAGSGRDLATAGGAVAGAVIGANVDDGRPDAYSTTKVQRCTAGRERERPQYWDVVYVFRGTEHHMQTVQPPAPGSMITVNEHGEPRTS